jgi:hypothetical protein
MSQDTNDVKRVKMVRRRNAEAPINLSQWRKWHDDKEEPTPPSTTQEGSNTPDNVGGDSIKTPGQPATLHFTQDAIDKMQADRAAQAKRSLLKQAGVENVETLTEIVNAYKEQETKRLEAEEAAKTDLQKKEDEVNLLKRQNEAQVLENKKLLINYAVSRLAPGKDVPANRIADLLMLMDTSGIEITNGKLADKDIEAAIDAALKDREYLKEKTRLNSKGTPQRPRQGIDNVDKPVQRKRRKASI